MPNDRADVADAPTRRQGVAEQLGFTSAELLRALPGAVIAAGLAFVGAVFFANRVGLQGAAGLGFVVTCTGVGFAAGLLMLRTVVHGAAAGIAATVLPSGASTAATDDYSREDALLMQRDVEGALESFETKIADDPRLVGARLRAADLYAGAGGDPRRAERLYREVQRIPGVAPADAIYASNRLVDLYDGVLADTGRAVVELRRLIDTFPGTQAAVDAARGLATLKGRLAEERAAAEGAWPPAGAG